MTVPPVTKPLLKALAGQKTAEIPLWLMRQAGRYLPEYRETRAKAGDFLSLCYTPELATEVTLQPISRYRMDAAILFSDILVIPDALGQNVSFREGEGPCLPPLEGPQSLDALNSDRVRSHLDPVFRTVSSLASRLPQHTTLIGFCGAPWTVATYMIEGKSSKDFSRTKTWAYSRPKDFARLIALLEDASVDYLCGQIEAGAEALQIFDSWAGVLPEKEFYRWALEPVQRIVSAIKDRHPDIPIIGFPRGAGLLYEQFVRESGCHAISLDTTVPLEWAARTLQPHMTVQGNLDPVALLAGGEYLDQAVDAILHSLGHGPFVFNLGHGILPATPPENVSRLVERVRSFTPGRVA
ncbi:uroporphyrinogen decarboxylase [Haematospirillum sp. 15-248]|uniref:uroporphyrinogen decarboxylase n=1 Tax=Haematospirillum sp. 15-248 TaxID=2723107 RepID=UPI001ADE0944|nr:uroporphyrinogen decarboxylase [Haematospirillum sp. 15-248]